MAIQQALPPAGVQHAPSAKKRSRFWVRAKKGFVTSIYITHFWEWFLGLAGRLVAPVLFFTIMYNVAETYPGFSSPWAWIGQAAFMLQNGALDIGSFGLPKLADQAEQDGNTEGARKARDVGQALFWIMISNLVWGGIEHVIGGGMPDGVKTFVALVFLIVRAYYAISYTKVIHSMKKEEAGEEEDPSVQDPASSPVAPAIDYAALVDLLKPHLDEIRASLLVDLKPVPVDLDYLALAKMVAPHVGASMADLSPVVPQVDLKPVDLTKNQVDLSPVPVALSPVALASTQVDLSPVPPKEPGPAPLVKASTSGSQVAPTSGSELEKGGPESSRASVAAAKSTNEERDRKLAVAYAAMIEEGKAISGRTLAATAKCARPAASEWLRLLLQVAPTSGPESSSGPGSSGLEASGSGSEVSGPESSTSGPGSGITGSGKVDLKPRSRVRNTDELMALDLEMQNA